MPALVESLQSSDSQQQKELAHAMKSLSGNVDNSLYSAFVSD